MIVQGEVSGLSMRLSGCGHPHPIESRAQVGVAGKLNQSELGSPGSSDFSIEQQQELVVGSGPPKNLAAFQDCN